MSQLRRLMPMDCDSIVISFGSALEMATAHGSALIAYMDAWSGLQIDLPTAGCPRRECCYTERFLSLLQFAITVVGTRRDDPVAVDRFTEVCDVES